MRDGSGDRVKHLTLAPPGNVSPIPRLYESSPGYAMPDADHLITLGDLLRVLRVRWKMILLSAIAVAALAMIVTSLITPVYMGSALVMVDQQRNRIFNEQNDPSVLSNLPSDPTSIESQVQMLQSHSLAGEVVDKLNLVNDPEFNGAQSDLLTKILNFKLPDFVVRLAWSIAPG